LVSFLVALVKPDESLRTLFFFNLVLGVDLTISPDGKRLFDGHFIHKVNHTRIGPHRTNMFPCDSRFQLAEENGQTEFTDAFGGSVSFYFPRAAGQCCLPWDFDLELVRFEEGPQSLRLQGNIQRDNLVGVASCLAPNLARRNPDPHGVPPNCFHQERRLDSELTDAIRHLYHTEPVYVETVPVKAFQGQTV
jgi:hypothetical protein